MKIRISQSVSGFLERAKKYWGLKEWEGVDDPDTDLLFFGLYNERDYEVFQNHEGKKTIFWCGSDILNLMNDYERRRIMKNEVGVAHYCENDTEAGNLKSVGIDPIVIPSFLDDISKYPLSFQVPNPNIERDKNWKVWLSCHTEREEEYGVNLAGRMAERFPDIEFHIYGADREYERKTYNKNDYLPNMFFHGWVDEETLNKEIRNYHCGFRANEHDGVSEVMIKAILLGQYCITRIKYDEIWNYTTEGELAGLLVKLKEQTKPNFEARSVWLRRLNAYPWCRREFWHPETK